MACLGRVLPFGLRDVIPPSFFFTFLPKYFNVYVIKRHIFCTGYLIYMVWLHAVSVELR